MKAGDLSGNGDDGGESVGGWTTSLGSTGDDSLRVMTTGGAGGDSGHTTSMGGIEWDLELSLKSMYQATLRRTEDDCRKSTRGRIE